MKNQLMMTTLVSLFVLASVPLSHAGQWHTAGSLNCSECHIGHGSEAGQELPGGPFSYLLRKNSINEMCLSCHDGTNPSAPDVASPTPMYAGRSLPESGAGSFLAPMVGNPGGHDLGLVSITPLQTAGTATELSCASCHAVHGNGNYRNLLYDPANDGSNFILEVGQNLFTQYDADIPPTPAGSVNAYARGNTAYSSGYSAWCSSCHDQLRFDTPGPIPAHFSGHPVEATMNQGYPDPHTDLGHWRDGTGEGFAANGNISGIERVPFQTPGAVDRTMAATPGDNSQVFCLSCHKAHGGANRTALLWPYAEGGDTYVSGCQQCHNK